MILRSHLGRPLPIDNPVVLRVREGERPDPVIELFLARSESDIAIAGSALTFARGGFRNSRLPSLPADLDYLTDGDLVRITPEGYLSVIYRRNSPHNSIFVTERCNSKCVMCSQPPRDVDDRYHLDDWIKAIPLVSQDTAELGITGGEPTLYWQQLLELITALKVNLPRTAVHMLTNGRTFASSGYAQQLGAIGHADLMLGIPLYSDLDYEHDFVVQAKGAFSGTMRGYLNLARAGVAIEIRVVLHQLTYRRLPQLARFISRNLPFAKHVALMGLELMGYAKSNLEALWIDPVDYARELSTAVDELSAARLNVSIYNLPLCLVEKALWPFARQSISDWKNIYLPICSTCSVRSNCSGFFASSPTRLSKNIRPFTDAQRF